RPASTPRPRAPRAPSWWATCRRCTTTWFAAFSTPTCTTNRRRSTRPRRCSGTSPPPGARSGAAMAATDTGEPQQAVPAREELIRCYRELASTMSLMAALTRAKDWTRLPELEGRCTVLVERLKAVGAVPLAAGELAHV